MSGPFSTRGPALRWSAVLCWWVWLGGAIVADDALPRRGGLLRLWNPTDWRSLDPAIAFDAESAPFQKLLFRGLLNYGKGTDLVLDQAAAWEVSPDGRTYRLQLKPGVRFAHGREVEAQDYVAALERILDPATGSPGLSFFLDVVGAQEFSEGRAPHVAGLRASDARTLEIELRRPVFTFRYVLAMNFADAVPRELFSRGASPAAAHLLGSGPYRIAEWRRGLGYRLVRNPHYTGTDGFVDEVALMLGGEASSAALMLERGELDRVNADPPTRLRFQRDPRLRAWMHRVTPMDVGYLFLNTEMKPFDDVRVRRAVNHAVNRARVVGLTAGQCVVADGIVPALMPWSNPGRPEYPFNPDRARALLREAGLADGFATELWYIQSRAVDQRVAVGLQQDLAAVGIRLELRSVSYPAFETKVRRRGEAACGIWGWLQDYPDPSTFLDTLLNGDRIQGGSGNNQAYYNNPAFNRCVNEAATLSDAAARLRLFREAEDIALRDAPWVPLYHEQYSILRSPRLHGDVPHPVWLWRYETMWLSE